MDKDKVHETLKAIGSTEDEAERRELIAQLDTNIDSVFDERDKAVEDAKTKADEAESLRQYNMKLFLRLGADKPAEQVQQENTGVKPPEESPKLSFKDLFNEKGEIK